MWADPRVIITSRVSVVADQNLRGAIALSCDNPRYFIAGKPMRNVIDWGRGY